jgi:pimeloyl-ACP methyl ester carboxylesterase
VLETIGEDTRVVVAHSLGSVVAYEALCARPGHGVRALVTIGSPLGIPNVILHRLEPAPLVELGGAVRAVWPGGPDLMWTNITDDGDVVALAKDLRPAFGESIRSVRVHNGSHAHDATAYLTDALCGRAIAAGLA